MSETIAITIGGVRLTESDLNLLAQRQITVEMLQYTASNSDDHAMRLYIHSLLSSSGDYSEVAGPMIDYNNGVNN